MPRMSGTTKIHKEGHPIRPIVDTRNIVTGPLAEILAQILTLHKNKNVNFENTEDIIQKLQQINIREQANSMTSYWPP